MTQQPPRTPPHRVARDLYGDALGAETPSALADAMDAWQELDDGEQRYVVAHLLFLQIEAQAQTRVAIMRVRDAVDDLSDTVGGLGRRDARPEGAAGAAPVVDAELVPSSVERPPLPE